MIKNKPVEQEERPSMSFTFVNNHYKIGKWVVVIAILALIEVIAIVSIALKLN